jgi:pimeloyl-ACP methyl ester carboxylesterase
MTTPYGESVALKPDLDLHVAQAGTGRPALILHGGAGPASVTTLVAHLSKNMQTITPTHPGWEGTPLPAWLSSIGKLAQIYLRHLYEAGLHDVLVVGSSIGGWIAAEMAVRDADHRIGALVLIDAVGITVAGEPILNVFENAAPSVFEATFYDSAKFAPNLATMTDERVAQQRSNMAALRALAGEPYMHDPRLLARINGVRIPTLVLWGANDGIATPAYGRAYAAAFADAQFETIEHAGHLPHIEQPEATLAFIDDFTSQRLNHATGERG